MSFQRNVSHAQGGESHIQWAEFSRHLTKAVRHQPRGTACGHCARAASRAPRNDRSANCDQLFDRKDGHDMPPPIASSTPPQRPTDRSRRFAGWWYIPVTILTAGLFAWVPFLHATVRLSRPLLLWWTALYLALATAVVILPVNTTPSDTPDFGSALPGLLAIVVVVAGSIQQWYLRR